jgi:hypothetical protein
MDVSGFSRFHRYVSRPPQAGRSGETEATMAEYVSGRLVLEAPSGLSDAEIRLLPAMPLHAITTVHGEAGLGSGC